MHVSIPPVFSKAKVVCVGMINQPEFRGLDMELIN